ncbi:MAG: enoyl-CoA hydratase/isomerase family protein [Sphingobacterium sp.]
MDSPQNFLVDKKGKTAYLTVNRPDKLNALNFATIKELGQILQVLKADTQVRGIIVTGAGAKAFVAGADISEFKNLSRSQAKDLTQTGHHQVMDVIYNFPKPVIAAVNGFALGGGLELAMACHLRVASANAKMGLPEVSLGLIPGYGGTQRLPQLVGRAKALEMIMSGEMIDAQEALQWGLVNYVVPQESLITKCEELLEKMYTRSPHAIATAINVVNEGLQAANGGGYNAEIEAFTSAFDTEDFKEGVSAFLEKRKPNF